jgi:hypothetical protein
VHKGECIDPSDYLWPKECDPLSGIAAEAAGRRQAPLLEFFAPTPTYEGRQAPRGAESIIAMDTHQQQVLAGIGPRYGLPVRRQMQPQR